MARRNHHLRLEAAEEAPVKKTRVKREYEQIVKAEQFWIDGALRSLKQQNFRSRPDLWPEYVKVKAEYVSAKILRKLEERAKPKTRLTQEQIYKKIQRWEKQIAHLQALIKKHESLFEDPPELANTTEEEPF